MMEPVPDLPTPADETRAEGPRQTRTLLLVRAILFGVGVGLGCGLVAAIIYWVAHRPRAWNSTDVTAVPIRAYVAKDLVFAVQYRVRNNTQTDYRIGLRTTDAVGNLAWNVWLADFRGLTRIAPRGTRVEHAVDPPELFLPPGQEVGLTLQTLLLVRPDDPKAKIIDKLRKSKFRGFVIYDDPNRLRIELPFADNVLQVE